MMSSITDCRTVPPRPQDLTVDKIVKNMSDIRVGDIVTFESMKECYSSDQVARSGYIRATGEVVENCGGYLMVKLQRGLLESVNYFGIYAVNGLRFYGYSSQAF